MFERFTDAARRAMVIAREEARALNHPTVRVEHILLGVLEDTGGITAQAIALQGLDLDAIRSSTQEAIGERSEHAPELIYNSDGVKKAIKLTLIEALELHHDYIGTEHLLLGLMREMDGAAAQVLAQHGANLAAVRETVRELARTIRPPGRPSLDGAPPASPARAPARFREMFERFTDRARRVVVLAQVEARHLNQSHIGTEHLLLGLLNDSDGVTYLALTSLGIDPAAVRLSVINVIGEGTDAPPGHMPFTPRVKKVLELSLRESLQMGHNYIDSQHILLALIREGKGVAAQVLIHLGAHLETMREIVTAFADGTTASRATPGQTA